MTNLNCVFETCSLLGREICLSMATASAVSWTSWLFALSTFFAMLCAYGLGHFVAVAFQRRRNENSALVDIMRPLLHDVVAESMNVGSGLKELGLRRVFATFSEFDMSTFRDSRILTIVLNDGRTWLSVNRELLRGRLSDPAKVTIIFLIHPDSSHVDVLARKGGREPAYIRGKIEDTVQCLKDISNERSNLIVYGHFLFNPHSLVLGDSYALVTPYFAGRIGRVVPAFLYENCGPGSFYDAVKKDLDLLTIDSGLLWRMPAASRESLDEYRSSQ